MTDKQPDEALEKLNQGIQESRQAMQRQTMELAQEYFGDSVEGLKRQIKESRSTVERLPEQLPGGQEESFQMLFQELMTSYSKIENCLQEAEGEVASLDTESLRRQGEVEASEAALREAREHGVDLTQVEGSGEEGRVLVEDVKNAGPEASEAALREAEKRDIDLSEVEATGAGGRIIVSDVVEFAENRAASGAAQTPQAPQTVQATEDGSSKANQAKETANGQVEESSNEADWDASRVTSAARRKAEDLGVDLSGLEGSGADGLVTLKDVLGASR
jgi:pyruvate/2-oxoglutarate dehydrogenase complex dihydrolipoamide acyltransferase (E2) component